MAVTPPRSWADRNKWCSLSSFSHSSPLLQSYSSVRGSLETMHLKIKSKICLLTPVVSLLQLPFFFFFSLCEKKKANIISMLLFPFLFVFECVCYFRSRLTLIFCRLPLESQRWRSVCQAARRHLSPFRNNFLCTGAVAFLLQLEHWLTPFPPRGLVTDFWCPFYQSRHLACGAMPPGHFSAGSDIQAGFQVDAIPDFPFLLQICTELCQTAWIFLL